MWTMGTPGAGRSNGRGVVEADGLIVDDARGVQQVKKGKG